MNTATTPARVIKARRSVMENIRRDLKTAPLTAWFGMIVILLYAICAIFAPLLAPYGESEIVGKAYQLSSPENWLGTDQIGRDTLSRLIYRGAKHHWHCPHHHAPLVSCGWFAGRARRLEARLS